MRTLFPFLLLGLGGIIALFSPQPLAERSVYEVQLQLGADPVDHLPDFSQGTTKQPVSVERGRQLVETGQTRKGAQSNHFVCTSCHLTQIEDPELTNPTPEARLEYARANDLPFLAATTLYGVVNRTSYYNGDYVKKYGDLVIDARYDLRKAIQLCATECAQGRPLEPADMESVLAYLWTLELKMADLQLAPDELRTLENSLQGAADPATGLELLRAKYLSAAGATFGLPPENYPKGYPQTGQPEKGRAIYEQGCLHCHERQRYSFYLLDNSPFSFRHLAANLDRYDYHSIYHVIRYGTSPVPGKRAYMPHYTLERMSDQQVEDLRAYIEREAE